jgi:hypothetical protein
MPKSVLEMGKIVIKNQLAWSLHSTGGRQGVENSDSGKSND